jgi:branched-chain amino acid transport system substrate-binding protein
MKKLLMVFVVGLLATFLLGSDGRAEIQIGVAAPMTGAHASYGQVMVRTVEKVVREHNDRGGVLGQPLKLLIFDDECNPSQAIVAANRMVKAGVQVVIGHLCKSASLSASRVYAEENILQISPPRLRRPSKRKFDSVFYFCDDFDGEQQLENIVYSAVEVFVQATDLAGSTRTRRLVEQMKSKEFKTSRGNVRFDESAACLVLRKSAR